jgi:ProP effector
MTFKTEALLDILKILAAEFPQAFVTEQHQPDRPFKIGVDVDLAERYPALSRVERGAFLRFYTSRISYLAACVEGAPRIDLDGNIAGHVTADEAAHAVTRLAEIMAKRAAQRVAAIAAKKAEREAARKKAATPTPLSPSTPPSPLRVNRPLLSLPGFQRRAAP